MTAPSFAKAFAAARCLDYTLDHDLGHDFDLDPCLDLLPARCAHRAGIGTHYFAGESIRRPLRKAIPSRADVSASGRGIHSPDTYPW